MATLTCAPGAHLCASKMLRSHGETACGRAGHARWWIIAGAALWSTGGLGIKLCDASAWQVACFRSLFAAIALYPLLRRSARGRDAPVRWLAASTITYAGTVVLFVLANRHTSAAHAIFIQDTAPAFVMGISFLLWRLRPTRAQILALPGFALGLALLVHDARGAATPAGDALALASGVAFAGCIVSLKALGPAWSTRAAWLGNLLAALLAFPLARSADPVAAVDLAIMAALGTFQLAGGYACFARGLPGVSATEASLLVLLEPVLNPVWVYLFLGEGMGAATLLGGAIIVLATAGLSLAQSRTALAASGRRVVTGSA